MTLIQSACCLSHRRRPGHNMRFISVISISLSNSISRHFSSLPKLPKLRKIRCAHRARAVLQAQQALTDYLHTTRSLSFTNAEHISKNSLVSLSDAISRVEFSPSNFSRNFLRYLRYNPINEFEFFYESIGIDPSEIEGFLPENEFFLSEDRSPLNVACALSAFGFPWNKLGRLCKEEISIFDRNPEALIAQVCGFKARGFNGDLVIGICLAFPFVLNGDGGGDVDALFDDLKRWFTDFDLRSSVELNVDDWYQVCRKIRVFYHLDCKMGRMGDLLGSSVKVFLECPEEVLIQKVEYFCRFGVRKEEVAFLLLQYPEILNFDLESPVISVSGFLKLIGLNDKELDFVSHQYPYVLGKNKLANLPHLMRAVNLHEWFFDKIKNGNHHLLANYVSNCPDGDVDNHFKDGLERIQCTKKHVHNIGRLNFLLGIGFGENAASINTLKYLSGSRNALQERFDCLLKLGIEFSELCKMVSLRPNILNQSPDKLKLKVNFLLEDMGCSLDQLYALPKYMCFSLENTIKPRYRFHLWLAENGLVERNYSLESILATSEKVFMAHILGIHPAALKQWLECFSFKTIAVVRT